MNATAPAPSETVPPRLRLERLSALQAEARGAHRAGALLRDVSFELGAGRCLALLGGVGDGGRLLLDIVAGHATPSAGRLLLDGRDLDGTPPSRRRIGMVSVRDPLFAHLDVRANIAFPLRVRGVPGRDAGAQVDAMIALLGLDSETSRRPHRLDPVALLRVKLARALVFAPDLLLLDDPLAGLPSTERAALLRLLRRLAHDRGLTALLHASDRDDALRLGDEIGVLDAGTLRQIGPAQRLLDRPADAVVAQRLGDANLLTGLVLESDDDTVTVRLRSGGEMRAMTGDPLQPGHLCQLCIRPERIAVAFLRAPGAEDGADALPAVLLEAIQMIDHIQLRFRLVDGTELLARRSPAAAATDLRPGRHALLAWQAHQAHAFAGTEATATSAPRIVL